MQLMDNFRVFEPIVSFSAEAHATSLSWAIFNDLGGETRQLSSAAGDLCSYNYWCRDPFVAGFGAHLARIRSEIGETCLAKHNANPSQSLFWSSAYWQSG
jgi:hypothetical protein